MGLFCQGSAVQDPQESSLGLSANTRLYTTKHRHCQQGRGRRSQSNQSEPSALLVLLTRPHARHGCCSRVGAAHGRLALFKAHRGLGDY